MKGHGSEEGREPELFTKLMNDVVGLCAAGTQCYLLRWCFEPSQPQRVTLGLKINFSLSPNYSYDSYDLFIRYVVSIHGDGRHCSQTGAVLAAHVT